MPRSHSRVAHDNAKAIIDYLMGTGGHSSLSSRAIARSLGMSIPQFHAGRRHTLVCTSLGNYAVAYRGINQPIVLLDPSDAGRVIVALVNDRSDPMFSGARRLRDNWLIAQSRIVAIIEAAAREALAKGDKPVADALGFAAQDYAMHGTLQPATAALLRTVGVSP